MLAFIATYERVCSLASDGWKPGVHHLLLTFLPEDCDTPACKSDKWIYHSRGVHYLSWEVTELTWEVTEYRWISAISSLLKQLFLLVAPSLRTLAFLKCEEIRPPLACCMLPALRELTLLADDMSVLRQVGVRGGHFPALTHLHIVCEDNTYEDSMFRSWGWTIPLLGPLAPALTHLRISHTNTLVAELIDRVLGAPPHEGAPPTPRTQLPFPRLQWLVIQCLASQIMPTSWFVQKLWETAEMMEEHPDSPQLIVLSSRAHNWSYWPARLPWEWVARMDGPGSGRCWAGSEEDEAIPMFDCVWGRVVDPEMEEVLERNDDTGHITSKKRWWKRFRIRRSLKHPTQAEYSAKHS
ncbi:hypothetical protein A0H81_13496 [Grifola frondosa]|uniref:Uncharacterized protein n=1 Tax=Grifola frondosa TaxID=5627 RepID=A0A1C7LPG9_GRIFR|nr:hypothetical protein A0H81_13496 [Grifola frondosa]